MNKLILIFCFSFNITLFANEAQDLIDKAQCMECHSIYDFGDSNSKVKNQDDLYNAVDSCQRNNDAMWFEEETSFVADYLNRHYYKFKKK